jgi:hypothetical protein
MTILKHVKLEYIQKHRKYLKRTEILDDSGVRIPGTGKRTKGIKRGVMIAGINDDNEVIIGFSLCHKLDLFDHIGGKLYGRTYVGGQKSCGFGVDLAMKRAEKWQDRGNCLICGRGKNEGAGSYDPKDTVLVPSSIEDKLCNFVVRCSKYYKEKSMPAWACILDLPPS